MIASEQSTAPHAYKDHLSHSWGDEQRLTLSHYKTLPLCFFQSFEGALT